MTVVAGWFAGRFSLITPPLEELPAALRTEIGMGAAMNSKVGLASAPGHLLKVSVTLCARSLSLDAQLNTGVFDRRQL